jgi:hypothetical protein
MPQLPTSNVVESYGPLLVRAVDVILHRGFSEKRVAAHRILRPLQRAFEPVLLEVKPSPKTQRFSDSPVIEMQMRLVESALYLRCYVMGLVFCDYFISPAPPSGIGSNNLATDYRFSRSPRRLAQK